MAIIDTQITPVSDKLKTVQWKNNETRLNAANMNIQTDAIQSNRTALSKLSKETKNAFNEAVGEFEALNDRCDALQDSISRLLYDPITIETATISPLKAEKGSGVGTIELSVTTNKDIATIAVQSLNNLIYREVFTTPNITVISKKPVSIAPSITKTTEFTITVTNQEGSLSSVASTKRTITFDYKYFYGVQNIPNEYNNDFIRGMSENSVGLTSKFTVSDVGNEKYIYYCCPSDVALKFTVNGFEGGFDLVATDVGYSLPDGTIKNYNIYRSTNANLGKTTVNVSKQ